MNVLAVNCGTSSLRFAVIETSLVPERRLVDGWVAPIGGGEAALEARAGGRCDRRKFGPLDHAAALARALDWVGENGLSIDAVGYRLLGVDGGSEPRRLDGDASSAASPPGYAAGDGAAIAAIRFARGALGEVPMVAVFDSAFHRTLPDHAAEYALPRAMTARHGIRRRGLHGLAHRSMAERFAAITSKPLRQTRIVTVQLGSASSAAAIDGGRAVDVSTGFSGFEGLVSATSCGDVDPMVADFLARQERKAPEEIRRWLASDSGLLGVSGKSGDVRSLLDAERAGDRASKLAIDVFCYRIRKYIGAYLAVLGGADAVVFGGGVGENEPAIRERACRRMEWCGILFDEARNREARGREMVISRDRSPIAVHVIPPDEELMIARDTTRCLQGGGEGREPLRQLSSP